MGKAAKKYSSPVEPVTSTKPDLDKRQKELLVYKGSGFDLRSRIVDPKTGETIRKQPYRLVYGSAEGDYVVRDGKRFTLSGTEISAPKAEK